ncbi:acyl-CoA desaturase [Ideonella sp. YS5]|uniref:acyl-CoA desaturase n=1 Tax=Ideonella sp. YS5 TaxID=3453714 RepID=UPI003EEA6296
MTARSRMWQDLRAWFDGRAAAVEVGDDARRIDPLRQVPFVLIHLGAVAAPFTGISATALAVAALLYGLRMFAITAFYHRYFSHQAFRTSRAVQFMFAVIGAAAAQRGPLWWASHHRHHHVHADREQDSHSALQHGLAWSHFGWFMARGNFAPRHDRLPACASLPELRFLDRWDALVPLLLCALLYAGGAMAERFMPSLGTSGLQLVAWGFCVSTVLLYHATFSINSVAHRWGRRRFATADASRNNAWLALPTFGEGWHNNHHRFPGSARQGLYWWEIDLSYYGLRLLEALGLVHDLRGVPAGVRDRAQREETP